jgi:thioester reductase-like protein
VPVTSGWLKDEFQNAIVAKSSSRTPRKTAKPGTAVQAVANGLRGSTGLAAILSLLANGYQRALTHTGHLLLTGATGLLGSYLLRDLLLNDTPLAVLARRSRRANAAERIELLLTDWERALGRRLPRPVVLEGDLTQPGCGLNRDDRAWLQSHCDRLLNNAASLSFFNADREGEPWRTNVTGTRNLLDLTEAVGINAFQHVSTAYVCGLRTDVIGEDELVVDQPFGNDYEQSKAEAETAVRHAGHLDSVTVYRPSIIVGDSHSGYTSTYHGFFAVLRLGHTLLTRVPIGSTSGPALLRLLGIEATDCKNFVPVDWVSAVISHAVGQPDAADRTFHLTHPDPMSMQEMAETVQEATETYSDAASPDDPDRCDEAWFAENLKNQLQVYEHYFRNDPVFDRTATAQLAEHLPVPELDRDTMMRMAKFAIAHEFGRQPVEFPPCEVPAGSVAPLLPPG